MPAKYALIIANSEYQDKRLAKLTAPEKDAEEFGRILRELAAFDEALTLKNAADETMRRAIARFFANRSREDLALFYFSGHGLKNERGRLFLAASDAELEILDATSVPAEFVASVMDSSRSQRQTLILDCCNSGAFERGTKGAGMGVSEAFQGGGYGRVVLTATDAVQYAWEANRVIGEAHTSLFTHFLIEGLKGPADLNGDGKISVDELYEYAYARVASATSKQTPMKWTYHQSGGEIFLRENLPPPQPKPAPLDEDLLDSLSSRSYISRRAGIRELGELLQGKNAGLRLSAEAKLREIAEKDPSLDLRALAKETLEKAGLSLPSQAPSSAGLEPAAKPEPQEPAAKKPPAERGGVPSPERPRIPPLLRWLRQPARLISTASLLVFLLFF